MREVGAIVRSKSERPVGGPAARAWGIEGLWPGNQSRYSSPRAGLEAGRTAALASSRTMHRSKHPITIRMAPKTKLTPDHIVILLGLGAGVDRTGGTFREVLWRARSQYLCTSIAWGV